MQDGEDCRAQRDKNRLSSSSSKDSGHNSGSMDRTSTGSSQSSQSQSDGRAENISVLQPPAFARPSECLYSTDSDFYYVDGKLKEINDFYREVKNAERLGVNGVGGVGEPPSHGQGVVIDPVYEIIPECSDGDEMYCLPQDSRLNSKPESGKLRNKSQEKIKSICRSISSPMKMNEFLQNKVRRSTSNYRQSEPCQSWLPSNNNNNNNNNNNTISLPPPPPPPTSSTSSSLRLTARKGGSSLSLVPSNDIVIVTD